MNQEIKPIIKLVAIYGRVSTGQQEKEKTIEDQLMANREMAGKNGWTIVKEYIDDGWSGDLLARPALDQLREDAKKKIWEEVIFYDPDRIARQQWMQGMIMFELEELGLGIKFYTTATPESPEDRVYFSMRGVFAQYEKMRIVERFRLGKLHSAKEGNLVTSRAPYGYKYIPRNDKIRGHYEIDQQEAQVVKNIFSWVADDGMTVRGVIKKLQELKIPPKKSKRGVWSTGTMCRLLGNRTYIGEAIFLRTCAVKPQKPLKNEIYKKYKKTSRKIRSKEEWIKIPVPTIIDNDLFERTAKQLKTNSAFCPHNKKNQYLLAGKIFCACGKKRIGEGILHGKHLYYRCADRIYSFPLAPKCEEKGINARIADELVWEKLKTLICNPDLVMQEMQKWNKKKIVKADNSGASIDELKKEILKQKETEKKYVTAYGAGVLTLEQFKEYNDDIIKKIFAIKSQVSYLEQQINQPANVSLPNTDELNEFCQNAQKMLNYLGFEEKQQFVRDFVSKVTANSEMLSVDGSLAISNNYGFRSISRNRRPAQRWEINSV